MIARAGAAGGAGPDGPADGPVRTCIGCRRRALAGQLLRLRAVDDPASAGGRNHKCVTIDVRGTLPGRGAWLHQDWNCLAAARKRGAFRRALRVQGPLHEELDRSPHWAPPDPVR